MFEKEGKNILVVVKGEEVYFGSTGFGAYLSTIEGLQLSYEGVIREFPDLKENSNWQGEAVKRFTQKIKSLPTEMKRADYIIEDLRKHYFVPLYKQKNGHRPERIK